MKFSQRSLDRLKTCHPDLVEVMSEAIKYMDFSIVCGHRGKEEQDTAYARGNSKLKWPNGKHNKDPSMAVDIAPYPYTENVRQWYYLAGFIVGVARTMGIMVRYGGDWDMDNDVTDNKFQDLGHFELVS